MAKSFAPVVVSSKLRKELAETVGAALGETNSAHRNKNVSVARYFVITNILLVVLWVDGDGANEMKCAASVALLNFSNDRVARRLSLEGNCPRPPRQFKV